jgi:non-ribosomal peptide synthetase component F
MSLTDQIQNYVETMVEEKVYEKLGRDTDQDTLIDVACVALNQLPARYIRYAVDFVFYMPSVERQKLHEDVENAVVDAISYVESHKRSG